MRLLIFHLPTGTDAGDLRGLLASCGVPAQTFAQGAVLSLYTAPGETREVFAVVDRLPDWLRASHLPERLNTRRLGHRPLWSWVTAMDWR
jgi:hypothetical protein